MRFFAAVLVPLVIITAVAGVVLVGPRLLNRVRGESSPEGVATTYVAAAQRGDSLRIRWLMTTEQEDLGPIQERIERYGAARGQTFGVAYEPHPIASYFVTARITGDGFADEIRIQQFGTRWYLIQLP